MTLPGMLRQAGYTTGAVGKWHLGLGTGTTNFNVEIKPGPLELGFDYFFGLPATSDRVPCVYIENRNVFQLRKPGDPGYVANPGPIQVSYAGMVGDEPTQGGIAGGIAGLNASPLLRPLAPYTGPDGRTTYQGDSQHSQTIIDGIARIGYMDGGENARWDDDTMASQLVSKASDYIAGSVAAAKPFFLYYAAHDIHVPHVPNVQFQGTSSHGIRGDAIHQFDWQVGQLVGRLADPNGDGNTADSVLDNTLVILSSDNGPVLGDGYFAGAAANPGNHDINGPYKGGKYSVNEGGHRVPFVLRWSGGGVPAGQVSAAMICQTDLLASFAALTGQALPSDVGADSENVLPALLGQSPQGRAYLVNQNGSSAKAIRSGALKYYFDDALFYNLAGDPGEATNVLAANASTANAMKAAYDDIAATSLSTPLSGWWPLDAASGTTARDLSGASHPASLTGSPAWLADASKPFLRFSGSGQSASIAGLPAMNGDFSAMLWARSPSAEWGSTSCLIARRPEFALETVANTKKVALVVYTAAGTPQRLEFDLASVPGFDLRDWHHYGVSHDVSSGTALIFVDGKERARATHAVGATGSGTQMDLARDSDSASFLACDCSDVRLYPRVLTPGRIANAASARLLDLDDDGMLDDWEMLHRLALLDASDATLDPDNDSLTNLAEFQAGSDPNANSSTIAGRWDLDDGSGTIALDRSGNGKNGNLVNGPAWTSEGGRKFLSFDGSNDYLDVPSFPNLTQQVTVTCWAKSDAANWNAAGCLVSRRGQWILHPWLNPAGANRLSFMIVRADTSAEVNAQIDLSTLPAFDIRQWHHYAGSYDASSGTVRIYVDGILRATTTISPVAMKATTNVLRIGGDTHTTPRYFGGDIDEVDVYPKVLSAAEIKALASGFDDDQDGIRDEIERAIIETSSTDAINTLAQVLPGDDFDGDRRTNLDEATAGTDPTLAGDFFKIPDCFLSEGGAGSSFNVRVWARSGRVYRLEESTTLGPPWSELQALGPFTEDQLVEMVQPELPGPKGFYRVKVEVPAEE